MSTPPSDIEKLIGDFGIDNLAYRYTSFIPRLYNLCKSLGMEPGKIMPSRAFCSDENQGYPTILIAKHFGIFPFNHGRAGGIVSTDRHGPHAEHGKDMVIIQASHVGYDPTTASFGQYRRRRTEHNEATQSCGKIGDKIHWYQEEYNFARENIYLEQRDGTHFVTIDNQLLKSNRNEGLFLNLDRIVASQDEDAPKPVQVLSTSRTFLASPRLRKLLGDDAWPTEGRRAIGKRLRPKLFYFRRELDGELEGTMHLEHNLLESMPWIVTSSNPLLTAAKINTQVEFDRTFRTIVKEKGYQGKNLVYVSGLNIDVSPLETEMFPLTLFVPWAAYIQEKSGRRYTLEQAELDARLMEQSTDNPDQIDLESAIDIMGGAHCLPLEGSHCHC